MENVRMVFIILLVSILSTCITYYINIHLEKGPVLASAVVTLLSGLILPRFFHEIGTLLALVATTGSYAAMVSRERFPNIKDMVYVGILCGTLFILTQDVFVGVGGRLGTIAAISGLTWLGINKVKGKIIGNKNISSHWQALKG